MVERELFWLLQVEAASRLGDSKRPAATFIRPANNPAPSIARFFTRMFIND
jgi:hypothetical protein